MYETRLKDISAPEFLVEMSGVEKFMVEKSGVEITFNQRIVVKGIIVNRIL